ncbi:amidase [Desulfovibrio sp. OttesenSCG-928-G15]|nr:amidase [Desulfovibrio sp. OttesenSCG-928-G15]
MDRRTFMQLSAAASLQAAFFAAGGLPRAAFAALPDKEDLAYMPAAEQIKRFAEGSLSPVDVLKAQIDRISRYNGPLNTSGQEVPDYKTFNGQVNAITYEHFEEALKAAKEAEDRYRAGSARPLEGLTVAVKDENDYRGWRVTMGAIALKDAPPCEEDCPVIDLLRNAGAVFHVQTTVPEYYIHGQTWSRLWGTTRNPWNLYYAVGGSSGGSGACLAAGFSTLATGSDMGGSIRVPAAMCGVYGFKPPAGRVPTSAISYETLGPLARSFDDLVMMQNAITGPHPHEHNALRPKLEYPRSYEGLQGVKIAMDYFDSWLEEGIDPEVRKSMDATAEVLCSQGATVDVVKLGWKSDITKTYIDGLLSTGMGTMFIGKEKDLPGMTTYAAEYVKSIGKRGPSDLDATDELAYRLHRQLQEEVYGKGYLTLIMPTLATPFFPATHDPTTDTVPVNGKPVRGIRFMLTPVWNLLHNYAILNIPAGLASNNVPMGVQVVGNTYDDLAAFRVGYAFSQAGPKLYNANSFPDYRNKE